MKRAIIIILAINCVLNLNAQSLEGLYFSDGADMFSPKLSFYDNTVSMILGVEDGVYIDKAKYSYNIINGIYRISILSEPRIELYLLFDDEFGYFSIISPWNKVESGILLNVTDERAQRLAGRGGGEPFINTPRPVEIRTSSFLFENGRRYDGNNLKWLFRTDPWAEGRRDAGIGDFIEFDFSNAIHSLFDNLNEIEIVHSIVISNGFFSHDNPSLYFRNNRVKRIRIEDMNGTFRQEFEVLDTPNLQTFRLNGFYSKIRITILDVYNGTEYNDTCINYLDVVKVYYVKP
jgi:hypothetical protein